MTSKKVTRKWEVFAGRNKFLCDGRLMTAPHSGIFYLTVFLITVTSTLFFIFDCPYLSDRITPAIPCVGVILFIFTMGSLLRTSLSDPGIIPRASQDEASYIEKQIEVPNSCNSPTLRPPPRTKEVLVRGQPVKLKYCYTCKIFRPPRASHCSLCDNCVDRFDHHCPWVGNCVGKRNYRFFYMFIISLAFLAVFIFACAITHIILLTREPSGLNVLDALRKSPASAVVCAICFLSVWSVLGMAGFHTYLITTDQTTNEDIKGSFSSKRGQESPNPYSRGGVCSNCWHVLCGPVTPSLIDRRGIVTNDVRVEMESAPHRVLVIPPAIVLPPIQSERPAPPPVVSYDAGEPIGTYNRPRTGSYTNLYRLDERECDAEGNEVLADRTVINPETAPSNGNSFNNENKESHLYSNIVHSSYMNHNLDLDPVVLTGSKENLMASKEASQQRIEMMQKQPTVKFTNETCQNVSYRKEKDAATISDELNHNTSRPSLAANNKVESGDLNLNTVPSQNGQNQTWADRLPRNGNNNNNGITVLSASKLRLLHDTTMIDTALDLDSLDGSTVSLWPATV